MSAMLVNNLEMLDGEGVSQCRLCRKSCDFSINVFDPNGTNGLLVWKIIKELLQLNVSKEDGLPVTICKACMGKVTEFKYFKTMCINSHIEFLKATVSRGLVDCQDSLVNSFPAPKVSYFCKQKTPTSTPAIPDDVDPLDPTVEEKPSVELLRAKLAVLKHPTDTPVAARTQASKTVGASQESKQVPGPSGALSASSEEVCPSPVSSTLKGKREASPDSSHGAKTKRVRSGSQECVKGGSVIPNPPGERRETSGTPALSTNASSASSNRVKEVMFVIGSRVDGYIPATGTVEMSKLYVVKKTDVQKTKVSESEVHSEKFDSARTSGRGIRGNVTAIAAKNNASSKEVAPSSSLSAKGLGKLTHSSSIDIDVEDDSEESEESDSDQGSVDAQTLDAESNSEECNNMESEEENHICSIGECKKRFTSSKGLNIHIAMKHFAWDRLERTTGETCAGKSKKASNKGGISKQRDITSSGISICTDDVELSNRMSATNANTTMAEANKRLPSTPVIENTTSRDKSNDGAPKRPRTTYYGVFPCSSPGCGKTFTTKRGLLLHKMYKHDSAANTLSKPTGSLRTEKSVSLLKQNAEDMQECGQCHKKFVSSQNLGAHLKTCQLSRKNDKFEKVYTSNGKLAEHQPPKVQSSTKCSAQKKADSTGSPGNVGPLGMSKKSPSAIRSYENVQLKECRVILHDVMRRGIGYVSPSISSKLNTDFHPKGSPTDVRRSPTKEGILKYFHPISKGVGPCGSSRSLEQSHEEEFPITPFTQIPKSLGKQEVKMESDEDVDIQAFTGDGPSPFHCDSDDDSSGGLDSTVKKESSLLQLSPEVGDGCVRLRPQERPISDSRDLKCKEYGNHGQGSSMECTIGKSDMRCCGEKSCDLGSVDLVSASVDNKQKCSVQRLEDCRESSSDSGRSQAKQMECLESNGNGGDLGKFKEGFVVQSLSDDVACSVRKVVGKDSADPTVKTASTASVSGVGSAHESSSPVEQLRDIGGLRGKENGSSEEVNIVQGSDKGFVCDVCKQSFAQKFDLRSHIVEKHMDFCKYFCKCGVCYRNYDCYIKHLEWHKKISTLQKPKGNAAPGSAENNGQGVSWIETYSEASCANVNRTEECIDSAKNVSTVCEGISEEKQRTSSSQNVEMFCNKCMACFSNKDSLKRHIYTTHGRRGKWWCYPCQRVFEKKNLDQHKLSHAGDIKIFQCGRCMDEFVTEEALLEHSRRKHKWDDIKVCKFCKRGYLPSKFRVHRCVYYNTHFECRKCGKKIVEPKWFQAHILKCQFNLSCHNCSECGKRLMNKDELHLHYSSHLKDKMNKCTKCPLTFKYKCNLWRHERERHSDEGHNGRKHSCKLCSKAFFTNQDLLQHEAVHSDMANFAYRSNLGRHKREVHEGRRAEKSGWVNCKECGKVFQEGQELKQHMEVEPYRCYVCDKVFRFRSRCFQHHMAVHPEVPWEAKMACKAGEKQPPDVIQPI